MGSRSTESVADLRPPRMAARAASLAVGILLIALLWPHRHAAPAPDFDALAWHPIEANTMAIPSLARLLPAGPAASCGADVAIAEALIDPTDRPDREGEWVRLTHLGPEPLSLEDWTLESGRRRLRLPAADTLGGQLILGGSPDRPGLGPLQLPNRAGELRLYDPCGILRARLAWGPGCERVPPGWTVVAPGHERRGPARSVTGGALGGCGQT